MPSTFFRTALVACVVVALTGCGSMAKRPADIRERDALEAAAGGGFDDVLRVAELYRARNDRRALVWYARAADMLPPSHETARAETQLGTFYTRGRLDDAETPLERRDRVIPQSPRKAHRWLSRAAYHGSPYAMADLARWHARDGDAAMSLRWRLRENVYLRYLFRLDDVREAARNPDAEPLHAMLSRIHRQAERGDAEAQVDLGALYEAGIGVDADRAKALYWYQRAGEQGNVYGQYFSGLALGRGGKGIEKDVDAAAVWFAKAEAQDFYMAAESYWRTAIAPRTFHFE